MPDEPVTPAQITETSETDAPDQAVEFDKWLADQPEPIRVAYDEHIHGLKSSLASERDERQKLAKQLRTLSKAADEGSELQKQLGDLSAKVTESDTKATFYEEAHQAGVRNLKLAWLAAKDADLFDKNGSVNFEQLKQVAPELFAGKSTAPPGHAGNGANHSTPRKADMNEVLRNMAGMG